MIFAFDALSVTVARMDGPSGEAGQAVASAASQQTTQRHQEPEQVERRPLKLARRRTILRSRIEL